MVPEAINPLNAFKSLEAGGGMGLAIDGTTDRGGQRRHRRLLRVLVVGRLRDDRGLRRGVAQPAPHRAPRHPDRRRRAGHLLHLRVLDDDRRQRQGDRRSRRPTPTPSACGSTWPRTSSAARSSATSTCSSSSSGRSRAGWPSTPPPAATSTRSAASCPLTANTLGRTHGTHGTPHVASLVQSLITLVFTLGFYFLTTNGDDPFTGRVHLPVRPAGDPGHDGDPHRAGDHLPRGDLVLPREEGEARQPADHRASSRLSAASGCSTSCGC